MAGERDLAADLDRLIQAGPLVTDMTAGEVWEVAREAVARAILAETKLATCADDWQGAIEDRDAALDAAEERLQRTQVAEAEVARLRQQIAGHCERIAAQSEMIARRAEGPNMTLWHALRVAADAANRCEDDADVALASALEALRKEP